jgi:oligopeptidase B
MPSLPIAPKREHHITQHGKTRNDEYYWLREKENPEVLKYLHAESDYLEEMMGHTKPLQEALFAEMKGRLKETDSSVPEKRGGDFYYHRMEAGKSYPIYCRKKGSLENPEEILLDHNTLAEGHAFCSVGAVEVSPDGNKLVYSLDYEGNEAYTIYIRDLNTGALFDERIANTSGSVYELGGVEWANDSETIYYVTLDEALRPDKLYRHRIGTDPARDVMLFHEADQSYFLWMHKSRDDKYIMTYHYSTNTREMRFISADDPEGELRVIQPRMTGLDYFAAHHHGKFYISNNDGAKNFKLSIAPVEHPGKENWQDVVPHRDDVLIEGVSAFKDHIVVRERKGGLRQLRICQPPEMNDARYVQFPEPAYNVEFENNPEFETNLLRVNYSSMVTPNSIVDIDMNTGAWDVKKVAEIPSGYNKDDYVSERIHATAEDGSQVPISLVYKKGLNRDGSNPTLLHGYGAYGAIIDAEFMSARLSLLDRGFVFAIGHIRGGLDMGRAWYEEGRVFKKKNTFTDFIACAEHLIKEGYTSKEKLGIIGVSAGGLLVTASMTMRPDLFKAVVGKVAFTDVVTSMSDPTIPLTTLEWNEWGDPKIPEQFEHMMSYSPYDNIRAGAYPAILLTTGLKDPRVSYWEPAKFAARLRANKTDDNLLLLKTNYNAGHAGSSGRYEYLKEVALEYAFLIDQLTNERNGV